MVNRSGKYQFTGGSDEVHRTLMNCSPLYAQAYYASHPDEEPRCAKADAAWLRKINGQPEPFSEEFQERFLSTVLNDDQFRRALLVAMKGPQ